MDCKVIRDSVHGYIEIPNKYIQKIVDTEQFQRLRYVEQTSMRCLYPCARHDRFSHSIGTYYLGKKLIVAFYNNLRSYSYDYFEVFDDKEWEKVITSFELACLLHDVGHAPFSHVIEGYMDYDYEQKVKSGLLVRKLSQETITDDPEFAREHSLSAYTNKHEKASALLVWKKYKTPIEELGGDPIWVMRMIMGYKYTPANDNKHKILNCIFQLLNGAFIDADKLDYIVRDTFSSGTDNFSVDLHRLINSVTLVTLKNNQLSIGYFKTSINVIQNIIAAKNNLYLWIYAHHKVQYFSSLLCRCFEKSIAILFGYDLNDDRDKVLALCSKFVSVSSMMEKNSLESDAEGNNFKMDIFLPSDSEIMHVIKQASIIAPNDEDFKELFSRKYKKSVWKSYAEYQNNFNFTSQQSANIYMRAGNHSKDIVESICNIFDANNPLSKPKSWVLTQAKPKLSLTKDTDIYISFDKNDTNAARLYSDISTLSNEDLPAFIYLYYNGDISTEERKQVFEIITQFAN